MAFILEEKQLTLDSILFCFDLGGDHFVLVVVLEKKTVYIN